MRAQRQPGVDCAEQRRRGHRALGASISANRPAVSLAGRARAAAGSFNKSSNLENAVAESLTIGSKGRADQSGA